MRRSGVGAGVGAAAGLALLTVAPAPVLAQRYLEPVPTRAGVHMPAHLLADEDAARALGIALADDAPRTTHGRTHVAGERSVLVVLGRFADSGAPDVTPEQVRMQLFTGTPSLADFYEEQSNGAFTVDGEVTEWIQSDVTLLDAAGFENGHGSVGDSVDVHIVRLLEQIDPGLDFGQFDNDGPDGDPNSGDDDGRVDFLSVKFAEVAGHCGGPGPWPHFGALSVGGEPFATNDITPAGDPIIVPVYIMDSVLECDGTTPQSISVTAHELGHAIGLPDYYRAAEGIEAENRHWAVGCFDLMAAGGWGCGDGPLPTDGFGPTGFSAYSLWTLGWADLEEVTVADDETFVLEPLGTSRHALRVRLAPESLESWIIEYRTRDGFDAPLPAEGVLIYHRDDFVGPRPLDTSLPPPYNYHLVEADGDDGLRRVAADGGNRGVAADVFASTDPSGPLGPSTVPSTRDHLGGHSTLVVHEITRPGPTASVRLSVGTGFRIASRDMPDPAVALEPMLGTIAITGGQAPYVIAEQRGEPPFELTVTLSGSDLVVSGTPRWAGLSGMSVWIEDQAGARLAEAITFRIEDRPGLDAPLLLRALVGAEALSPDEVDYLDRAGNHDSFLDLGDLRAFLRRRALGN